MIALIRLASLASALLALAACMHTAEAHCDLNHGQWVCSGAAIGGPDSPGL